MSSDNNKDLVNVFGDLNLDIEASTEHSDAESTPEAQAFLGLPQHVRRTAYKEVFSAVSRLAVEPWQLHSNPSDLALFKAFVKKETEGKGTSSLLRSVCRQHISPLEILDDRQLYQEAADIIATVDCTLSVPADIAVEFFMKVLKDPSLSRLITSIRFANMLEVMEYGHNKKWTKQQKKVVPRPGLLILSFPNLKQVSVETCVSGIGQYLEKLPEAAKDAGKQDIHMLAWSIAELAVASKQKLLQVAATGGRTPVYDRTQHLSHVVKFARDFYGKQITGEPAPFGREQPKVVFELYLVQDPARGRPFCDGVRAYVQMGPDDTLNLVSAEPCVLYKHTKAPRYRPIPRHLDTLWHAMDYGRVNQIPRTWSDVETPSVDLTGPIDWNPFRPARQYPWVNLPEEYKTDFGSWAKAIDELAGRRVASNLNIWDDAQRVGGADYGNIDA